MDGNLRGRHVDSAAYDEIKDQLRREVDAFHADSVVADLKDKPDNGDDRDIFGQALEDKLASDQHDEYVKENTDG